jgi:hypothetical protein
LANPAGNEAEKSDNPSADEHQEEEDSDQQPYVVTVVVKKTNTHFKVRKTKMLSRF